MSPYVCSNVLSQRGKANKRRQIFRIYRVGNKIPLYLSCVIMLVAINSYKNKL